AATHDSLKLPGEVDRIADAGVHPLPTHGRMDMGRVAQDEGSTFSETVGHPVVDVVDRKPVHLVDLELEIVARSIADVGKGELVDVLARCGLDGPDQADAALMRQWEN